MVFRVSTIYKTTDLGGKIMPDVLLSGDHSKIKDWRLSQSEAITRDRRPDLGKNIKRQLDKY